MSLSRIFRNIGPGPLIAAAFIGPGTVTACTLAGVNYGYDLMWAMVVSIIGTVALQSMTVRLGLATKAGLAENLRRSFEHPLLRSAMVLIMFVAIIVGNAAYEAGNISGAVIGVELIFGDVSWLSYTNLLLVSVVFVLLFIGNYKQLERIFIGLVIVMSIVFLTAALSYIGKIGPALKSLVIPSMPSGSKFAIMSLIGTTLVPYNLFLHSSLVNQKWSSDQDIPAALKDTRVSIILGGVISLAIIFVAASSGLQDVSSAKDLAVGIRPVFGPVSEYLIGIGLIAAGITSAIAAPLAASYVAAGCFGWPTDMKDRRFRMVWIFVLLVGTIVTSLRINLISIIMVAQFANGLLLPIVGGFLIYLMNSDRVKPHLRNNISQNILAILLMGFTLVLGGKSIIVALQLW